MDEILNTEDVVLSEALLDDLVVGERNALLVDFAVATLVDELTDGLQVGLAGPKSGWIMETDLMKEAYPYVT